MTKIAKRSPVELATPASPIRDRQWVADLVTDWLKTKSPTTLDAYRRDFEAFARWLLATGDASLEMANRATTAEEHVNDALCVLMNAGEDQAHRMALAYKAHLMESFAPRTVNRRLSSLRSLVALARLGWKLDIKGIPVTGVKDTTGVSRKAYLQMRSTLLAEVKQAEDGDARIRSLRDLSILHLWHDMGLRRASVWRLDVADVDLQRRTLRVYLKGKRHEPSIRPCPTPTCGVLKRYLGARGREPGPLFYSFSNRAKGQRLNPTSYNKVLTRIVELAEVDHANPHKFRHTAITRALDRGASIRSVAAFSGHADIRTVMIYDDNRGKSARQVAELVAEDDDELEDLD